MIAIEAVEIFGYNVKKKEIEAMRILLAVILTLFIMNGCGDIDGNRNEDDTVLQILSDSARHYLEVINEARSKQQNCHSKGIFQPAPSLKWNDALYKAALEHSKDMAKSNTFSHDGSGTRYDITGVEYGKKSSMQDRIENNGYSDWHYIGENITAGTNRNTAEKAIAAWLQSDDHCANLMNPNFTEVGMAHAVNANSHYTHYWTQDFGAR